MKHPAAGLTQIQKYAFGQIAISFDRGHSQRTLKSLLEKGLIERLEDKVIGRDLFGLIKIPQYQVPLVHHIQWCGWCAENYNECQL